MKSPEQIGKDIVVNFLKSPHEKQLVEFYDKFNGHTEVWFPELADAIAQAIQAERDAARGLVDALNAARDSICEQATDTMWVDKKYSPNCTTVDYIDLSLTAYKDAMGER